MLSRYVGRKVSAVSAILVLQHDIHDELEASTPFFDSLKVVPHSIPNKKQQIQLRS